MSRFNPLWAAALLLATGTGFAAPASTPAPISPPQYCQSAEHRQMDFWVGNWEARDKTGQLVGYQRIEKIERDCVLQEWWRGNGEDNGAGTSFSMYDQKRRLWNHSWFSARGNLLSLDGGWNGEAMIMTGYYINTEGQREFHRTIWKPLSDGRVYQFWESSLDGGLTWSTIHEAWMSPTDHAIVK